MYEISGHFNTNVLFHFCKIIFAGLFEWTSTSPFFQNGTSNLKSYIDLGDISIWGYFEITLTGNYSNQNTTGIFRKQFNIGRASGSIPHSSTSEVTAALGSVSGQWTLGEAHVNSSNHLVIPIYHLSNTGNYITVHIRGVSTLQTVNTSYWIITNPEIHSETPLRQYQYSLSKISVGTPNADYDAMLTVAGQVNAREIKVKIDAGADFVFDTNYSLMSLPEIERFINDHKHLPEINSALKMKNEGLKLAEMNIKLLQEIEELTLHLIEKDKQIAEIHNRLNNIEGRDNQN